MPEPTLSSRLAIRAYPKNAVPLMSQKWRNLLFMHWEYDAEEIQKTLPKGLYVDQHEGKAYIGIVAFFLNDLNLKFLPFFPGLSNFLELNCRTYVYDKAGVPGIWFYSLDANSLLAVQAASNYFFLPYFYAEMEAHPTEDQSIAFRSERQRSGISIDLTYKSALHAVNAEPESLEFFLIERYVLFAQKEKSELAMAQVHHAPYSLYDAQVSKWDDLLFDLNGLKRPKRPPDHLLFSPGVDVDVFAPQDI